MKTIKTDGYYLTFSIGETGVEKFYKLIEDAFKVSNRLSLDEYLDFEETPVYRTQIPYSSGYIQERYVYFISHDLTNYILGQAAAIDSYERFFINYFCWDFYKNNTLVLSFNLIQDIISVQTNLIDLTDYKIEDNLSDE
jgi:hypothetical protein